MKYLNLLDNSETELDKTVEVIEDDLLCIISIPHSSALVPLEYKEYRKWDRNILKDTDIQTDKLFNIEGLGVKIIGKCNPYFINYSRPRESYNESRGVLAWEFLDGSDIKLKDYFKEQIEEILQIYDKYHEKLQKYVDLMREKHGYALIIDGHGMSKHSLKDKNDTRPDICVGTLNGKTVPENTNNIIKQVLDDTKYSYSFNEPYKGGYITQKYSKQENVYVIQIETVKENYCDNFNTYELNSEYKEFKSVIEKLVKEIAGNIK